MQRHGRELFSNCIFKEKMFQRCGLFYCVQDCGRMEDKLLIVFICLIHSFAFYSKFINIFICFTVNCILLPLFLIVSLPISLVSLSVSFSKTLLLFCAEFKMIKVFLPEMLEVFTLALFECKLFSSYFMFSCKKSLKLWDIKFMTRYSKITFIFI